MAKFKVKVYWRHVMADKAEIEIEATCLAVARQKAIEECQKSGRQDIEWEEGEVIGGQYVAGVVTDEKGKQYGLEPKLGF